MVDLEMFRPAVESWLTRTEASLRNARKKGANEFLIRHLEDTEEQAYYLLDLINMEKAHEVSGIE